MAEYNVCHYWTKMDHQNCANLGSKIIALIARYFMPCKTGESYHVICGMADIKDSRCNRFLSTVTEKARVPKQVPKEKKSYL